MLVLTFRVGQSRLALDVRQIEAVLPRVALGPAAAGPAWLAGVFVYHGRVVPVVDLHRLVGAGECPAHLSSRIILVPFPGDPAGLVGLLAAHVSDIRDLDEPPADSSSGDPELPDLGRMVVGPDGVLHVASLERLLPASVRSRLAGLSGAAG